MSEPHSKADARNGPTAVDAHIGNRIRLRRTLMGLSQEKLGEALGITFQQIQKYERGANRVSASRLFELAEVLDVPIGFFYDGQESSPTEKPFSAPPAPTPLSQPGQMPFGFAETQASFGGAPSPSPFVPPVAPPKKQRIFDAPSDEAALFSKRETVDLVRAYYRIPDQAVRKRMLDLIRSLGVMDSV